MFKNFLSFPLFSISLGADKALPGAARHGGETYSETRVVMHRRTDVPPQPAIT